MRPVSKNATGLKKYWILFKNFFAMKLFYEKKSMKKRIFGNAEENANFVEMDNEDNDTTNSTTNRSDESRGVQGVEFI